MLRKGILRLCALLFMEMFLWGFSQGVAAEEVYTIPPSNFVAKMTVSGCFCTKEGKCLVLLRGDGRSSSNTWCLPARAIGRKESPIAAAVRELHDDLGLDCLQEELQLFRKFYVRLPEKDFELYLFAVPWPRDMEVHLEGKDHIDYAWVSLEEALTLPLIPGAEVYFRLLFAKHL